MDFNFDPEELQRQQDAAASEKRNLALLGGIGDALASQQSFGNFFTGKMNPQSTAASKTASALSDSIQDPAERRKRLAEAYLQERGLIKANEEDARTAALKDSNSDATKARRTIAKRFGVPDADQMSGYDIDQILDPKKMMETQAKAQVDFNNDMAKLRYSKDADLQKYRMERDMKNEDKAVERGKISEKQLGDVQQYDDSITSLQDMLNSFKPEYVGMVDGRLPDWSRGGDESAFRSRVGRYSDAYRKLITGAGASNLELKRLEGRLPQTTDTAENFQAKARALLDETQRAKTRHLSNLERLGKSVADFKTPVQSQSNVMLNEEDQKAIQWALQNSTDPRARSILEHNGAKFGAK